jgi:hypothetical protein
MPKYTIISFQIAHDNKHKYIAVLQNNKTDKFKHVPFGDIRYQHYHDRLGYYRSLDHKDDQRRRLYRARHDGEQLTPYTAGWFAWNVLW